ncbi:hypothetical protein KXS12_01410 [Priestia filamentosa]|uniref:methylmalonyl-CoA mutase family protein n=1 Tax=Priestia filamentosa TaxID=1402861 RepID=UPI003F16F1FE
MKQNESVLESDWLSLAKKTLKDREWESICSQTLDSIKIEPLYWKGAAPSLFTRTHRSSPYSEQPWRIALIPEDFSSYQRDEEEARFLYLHENIDASPYLENIIKKDSYFFIKQPSLNLVPFLQKYASLQMKGVIGSDPLGEYYASSSFLLEKAYDELLPLFYIDKEESRKLLIVDASTYEQDGATATQQLASAIAVASDYIDAFAKRGISPEKTAQKIAFTFSISNKFFQEIAKIRAFRALWIHLLECFHIPNPTSIFPHIHAKTSSRNKTAYMTYTNLLRTTTESLSALLGGVDSLYIEPYEQNSSLGVRMALNLHHILYYETGISYVLDGGGGSYYLESLTTEFAEKAWIHFQTIEKDGGMANTLKKGIWQREIAIIHEKEQREIQKGNISIVGTTDYINGTENPPLFISNENRRAFPYEKLRSSILATLPPSKRNITLLLLHKEQEEIAFFSRIFTSVGFMVQESAMLSTVEDLKSFLKEDFSPFYILCGKNELYQQFDLPSLFRFDKRIVFALDESPRKSSIFLCKEEDILSKLALFIETLKGDEACTKDLPSKNRS